MKKLIIVLVIVLVLLGVDYYYGLNWLTWLRNPLDWILWLIPVLLLAIIAYFLFFASRNKVKKPEKDADEKDDKPSPPKSDSDKGGGGFKKALGWFITILKILGVLLALYVTYLVVSGAISWFDRQANRSPAAIGASGVAPRPTSSRAAPVREPLGTSCPALNRGDRHACSVVDASDWIHFETGPQVAGYNYHIYPNYDRDRQKPERDRAYSEMHFLLEDGTAHRYDGRPLPRNAVAFRVTVRRPTELTYKMERVSGK